MAVVYIFTHPRLKDEIKIGMTSDRALKRIAQEQGAFTGSWLLYAEVFVKDVDTKKDPYANGCKRFNGVSD